MQWCVAVVRCSGVLQWCVAVVCCSVLPCVAVVRCSVLQCVAVCTTYLRSTAVIAMLRCVAVCCSVLQCVALCCTVLQFVALCCSLLHCPALSCTVLHCPALCCSGVLQCVVVSQFVAHNLGDGWGTPTTYVSKRTHMREKRRIKQTELLAHILIYL